MLNSHTIWHDLHLDRMDRNCLGYMLLIL